MEISFSRRIVALIATVASVAVGLLLLIAGVFQFSRLKHSCLRTCRSPLGFLLSDWRNGLWGAWRMGIHHGLYCLGCCWALMALLFVGGVMCKERSEQPGHFRCWR
jgi:predicted metal-binding membrane protein